VHDVDLRGGRAQGEGVVVVGRRAAHDVVGRRGALSQDDQHHRDVRLLDGVDQRLPQAQKLRLLGDVAHVDARGVLDPDDGQAVAAAQGHELVHLDEALPVELAPHGVVLVGVLGVVGDEALAVADDAHGVAVDLDDAAVDLGAVLRPELHVLRVVREPRQHLLEGVDPLGVDRDEARQLRGRELRLGRLGHAEELGVVGRQVGHPLLDGVEDLGLLLVDGLEEARLVVVDPRASRGDGLEVPRGLDERLGPFLVEVALGAHAADDAAAAHGDVGLLVGQQDRGADALVAAAGGVGAVDAGDDGNALLLELGVAEEAGALPPAVGVDLLLLGQLHAGAVDEPDERHVEPLGEVRDPQVVVGLPGDPGPGDPLVVEADQHAPLAADPGQAVDDVGLAALLALGVVDGVQGKEHPGVDDVVDPLPDRHLAALVDLLGGDADVVLDPVDLRVDLLHDLRGPLHVLLHPVYLRLPERLAQLFHLCEVLVHR